MSLRKLVLVAGTGAYFAAATLIMAAAPKPGETATSQSLLFDTPYLEGLAVPQTLSYSFQRKTDNEKVFGAPIDDVIRLKVAKSTQDDGLNSVSLEVFTGEKQRVLGPHADMRGNPVLMAFLELDLWHMKRRVGGVPVYFRNSIRRAFRDSATVEEIEIDFKGKTVPAHKITIKPFIKDPQCTPHAGLSREGLRIYRFGSRAGRVLQDPGLGSQNRGPRPVDRRHHDLCR